MVCKCRIQPHQIMNYTAYHLPDKLDMFHLQIPFYISSFVKITNYKLQIPNVTISNFQLIYKIHSKLIGKYRQDIKYD